MLSKHAISEARNESIAQIPNRPWDRPKQSAEHLPESAKRHQHATDRRRPDECSPVANKDQRVQTIPDFGFQQPLSRRPLKWCKSQSVFRISCQQPVHSVVAEPADTIEKDDGMIGVGGDFRVLVLHRFLCQTSMAELCAITAFSCKS